MIKVSSFDKMVGVTLGTYRLEQFLGLSDVGPNFLVRTDATSTYLLRFLVGPASVALQDQTVYLERFQYQASQIATLRHPYILPLLDFGVYRDVPYLISPHIPLRSLRTRIDKNGALNTFTVGRYLDQIATALEYTHEHAVLHGNLSVDSIFIRLDGNVVAADFGMKNLLNINGNHYPEWSDGLAPEQLLGKPASPASDVYALGAVVYYLLTGRPVFEGHSLKEIGQQHLYATIPPLPQQRNDLPPGLYGILSHALARDPAQRYHQPGAFANDFHHTVLPTNRARMPFVVSDPPFLQSNASHAGSPMAEMQFTENGHNKGKSAFTDQTFSSPHSLHGFSSDISSNLTNRPQPGFAQRLRIKHRQGFILIRSLILLLLLARTTPR